MPGTAPAVIGMMVLPLGEKRSKMPLGCLITLAAVAAGAFIMAFHPFHSADTLVYIVTLAIMAGVILECLELLRLYNRSCSNTLPQFESHTGGELL